MDKEAILYEHWKEWADKIFKDVNTSFESFNDNFEHSFVLEAMESYSASQNSELKKENEELKKKVNDLTFDNMTHEYHEYNEAEGNRVWPQIEEQIREDEREKLQIQIAEQQRTIDELKERLVLLKEENVKIRQLLSDGLDKTFVELPIK